MNGLKRAGVIGAVAIALLAGFVLVMQAWASSGTLAIGDGSAEPGGTGTVDLTANVDDEGLGAWTVDIVYDPTVVTAVEDGCTAHAAGVCNPNYDPDNLGLGDTVRLTGAVAAGLDGDAVLGTIEFLCADDEGSTDLTIVVNVFADATIGDPQDIERTVTDGSFTCEVEPTPEPTDEVEATATTEVTDLGDVGGGGSISSGTSIGWVILALAAIGVAGIVGFGALRVRETRS